MPAFLQQVVDGVGVVAKAIDFTTGAITILGILTTLVGYLSGRRRRVFGQSDDGAYEDLLAEMRQGFASLAAAIAAVAVGVQAPTSQPSTETTVSPPPPSAAGPFPAPSPAHAGSAPAPSAPGAPAPSAPTPPVSAYPQAGPSTPAQSPSFTFGSSPDRAGGPPVPPGAPGAPGATVRAPRRANHAALAIWAGVAVAVTFVGVMGVFITTTGTGPFEVFSLVMVVGYFIDIAVLIWSIIVALRMRRWGWAAALLLGSLGLTLVTIFTLPALLILIFAIWGPAPPPARPRVVPQYPMYPTLSYGATPYTPSTFAPGATSPYPGAASTPMAGYPAGYPAQPAPVGQRQREDAPRQ